MSGQPGLFAPFAIQLLLFAGSEAHTVEKSQRQHEGAPPDGCMQIGQHYVCHVSADEFPQAVSQDHGSINGKEHAYEKPD